MAWSDRRRTRLTAEEAERARALYVSGLTIGQVCAAIGASDKTVRRALRRAGERIRRRPLTPEEAREAVERYVHGGESTRALGRALGVSPRTIAREVRRHGEQPRPRGMRPNAETITTAVRAYEGGLSLREVRSRYRVSREELIQEGATIRPVGGRQRNPEPPSAESIEQAARDYNVGASLAQLWEAYGVRADDLRAAGVSIRSAGRPFAIAPGSDAEADVLRRVAAGERHASIAATYFVNPSVVSRVVRRAREREVAPLAA